MQKVDLAVIGTGPAGHRAAIQAAKLGKSVVAIEGRRFVGGNLVNAGSIPSKTLRQAVLYLTGFFERNIYGITYSVKEDITISDLMLRCEHVIKNETDVLEVQLSRNGVAPMYGSAEFISPHQVAVTLEGGRVEEIEAEYVIIATGSRPARTAMVPFNGKTIIDTDGVYMLQELPKRLAIVGAGVIGVEYACIFAALGIDVTLIEQRDEMLEFIDEEIREALSYHMREAGITFRFREEVAEVSDEGHRIVARTRSRKTIMADHLLYAGGRQGNTDTLNLAAAGLEADKRGRLRVNERFQTGVPHIYACGDVIGFPALAASSMEQGRLAARHAFGAGGSFNSRLFPYGIYTIPETSMVGRTEKELSEDGVPYEIGVARYREIARGQIIGDSNGLVKLLIHADERTILGVHLLGTGASELVHIGQTAMALGGTLDFFVDNVFNYPTLAECYKVAALDAYNKLS